MEIKDAIAAIADHFVEAVADTNLQPFIDNAFTAYMNSRAEEQIQNAHAARKLAENRHQEIISALMERWTRQVDDLHAENANLKQEAKVLARQFGQTNTLFHHRPSLYRRFRNWLKGSIV